MTTWWPVPKTSGTSLEALQRYCSHCALLVAIVLQNSFVLVSEEPKRVVSKRVVLADVPPERKPERGYVRMFPRNGNRNEGTFGKNHPFAKPPFYLPVIVFMGYRTIIARYVAKWGIAQMCLCKLSTTGGYRTISQEC